MVVAAKWAMLRLLSCLLILAALAGPCFGELPEIHVSDGPIASALALIEEKRVYAAIDELESYTPEFYELGYYHYALARAMDIADNPAKAAFHYRLASMYATQEELEEMALLLSAEAEFSAGYRFEAKNSCVIFLKKFPNSGLEGRVRILLGRSLASIGRHREAIRHFEMAGNTPEALFGKANTLQRMGMTAEATRAYYLAKVNDAEFPDRDDDTRLWLGENYRLSGMPSRAKSLLSRVKAPENLEYAAFGLAEIAARGSKSDSVILRFEKLASSKNRKLGRMATLRAAELEAANGKLAEAARRLEELIAKYPYTAEYDQAMLLLAQVRVTKGDSEAAMPLLLRLVARPSAMRAKALDEMERTLLAARAKGSGYLASIWNACGHWLMDPSREATLIAVADELRGTASYEGLSQWLSRYGSNLVRARYLERQAAQYAVAGDINGIRNSLQGLKNLGVSEDSMLRTEGYLKFAEKDYAGAEKALLSLKQIEGKDIEMLGELLPLLTNPQKTIDALEEAASKTGVSARVLMRLGDTHYEAGQMNKAVTYYRMAVDEDPEDEWSCYRLFVLLGQEEGEAYKKRIVKDRDLARLADALWKERNRNGK